MSKITVFSGALLALLTIGAVASASASAGWMVNGTELSGSAELSTARVVGSEVVLESGGLKIECKGKTVNGFVEITAPGGLSATSLEFIGCVGVGACELSGSTIKTQPISVTVEAEGTLVVKVKFEPKTGTLFANLTFTGASCATPGKTPITGRVTAEDKTGQMEKTVQTIKSLATATSGELQTGGGGLTLKGEFELELASGKEWSYLTA